MMLYTLLKLVNSAFLKYFSLFQNYNLHTFYLIKNYILTILPLYFNLILM